MVCDNLSDPSTLTLTGVACILRVLMASDLPFLCVCRMLAQAGLVGRLYCVIKQLITLSRQQQRAATGPGGGAALQLPHLQGPWTQAAFEQAFVPGVDSDAAAAAAEQQVTASSGPAALRALGSSGAHRGSPGREGGLAGEGTSCMLALAGCSCIGLLLPSVPSCKLPALRRPAVLTRLCCLLLALCRHG